MLSLELQAVLKPIRRVQTLLWAALTGAVFLYVFIAFFLVIAGETLGTSDPSLFVSLLGLAAVILAIGSLHYWRHTHANDSLEKLLRDPLVLQSFHKRMSERISDLESSTVHDDLSSFDRKRCAVAVAMQTPLIINLAFNETVALLGFVLVFVTREFSHIIPFAAVALVLNAMMFPRIDNLMARMEGWRHLG